MEQREDAELLFYVPPLILENALAGGRLDSGVAIAAKPVEPSIQIIAAELLGADDVAQSKIPMLHPNIIADGLRAQLGDLNYLVNFLAIFFSR